jgi:dTDP-4-amino-4,6-dideoxygalactose transaminase
VGIGAGDEVITVPNLCLAASEAISMVGATIRFVDVDPRIYTMDPMQLEEAVAEKSRAVIPVRLYGQPADMDAICEVSRRRSLFVIGDATQAHGARWAGQPAGGFRDCAYFSFYPATNLRALGNVGAVVTNNDALAKRIKRLRGHSGVLGAELERSTQGLWMPEWTQSRSPFCE